MRQSPPSGHIPYTLDLAYFGAWQFMAVGVQNGMRLRSKVRAGCPSPTLLGENVNKPDLVRV